MAKILLVEDDEIMARMYERALKFENFTVQIAHNGQEGYDTAKTFQPDLILLDVMMPVMNGLQALEKLKDDPQTRQCRIIMLTNLSNKLDAELALQKGAVRYLIKSDFDVKDVLETIKEVLNKGA